MEGEQSSTVARFIQRFREARPASPGHRHRHRAAMNEQFWWTKSTQEHLSGDELESLDEARISWESTNEEGGYRDVQSGLASERRICSREDDDDIECGSSGTEPPPSPRSPELLRPPSSDGGDDAPGKTKLEVEPQGGAAPLQSGVDLGIVRTNGDCTPPQSDTAASEGGGRVERDVFRDMDLRTSTLLERCRALLAPSSAAPEQETIHAELDAGVREDDVNIAEDVSGHVLDGDLDGLEQRARMLLGETAPPDRHPPPNIAGRLHSIYDPEGSCVRCQRQQPNYPTRNTELHRYRASPNVAVDGRTCSGMNLPTCARHGSWPRNTTDTPSTGGEFDVRCSPTREQEKVWPAALVTLLTNTDNSCGLSTLVNHPRASASPRALQTSEPCQPAQSSGCGISAKSASAGDTPVRANLKELSLDGVPADTHGMEWIHWLEEFVEDPVVQALLQRADDINMELMKRRSVHV